MSKGQTAQLNKLTQMMQNMTTKLRKDRATTSVKVVPRPARGKSRKRAAPSIPAISGQRVASIRLKHSEIFVNVTTGADGNFSKRISFRPGTTDNGAGYLAAQCKLHERLRWHNVTLEYVGAVGSTEGGIIVMGVDWLNTQNTIDLPHVVGLTPNTQTAIWNKARLTVPMSRMQAQPWLNIDSAAEATYGALCIYVNGAKKSTNIGYIRITYDVSLAGTRLP